MRSAALILACLMAAPLAGCSGGTSPPSSTAKGGIPRLIERPKVQNELKQIHLYYGLYITNKGRPPQNLEELKQEMEPNGREYQALRDGKYVFNWNTGTAGNKVLAYEKDADANGERFVLLSDGSIHRMSQQQFEAANK